MTDNNEMDLSKLVETAKEITNSPDTFIEPTENETVGSSWMKNISNESTTAPLVNNTNNNPIEQPIIPNELVTRIYENDTTNVNTEPIIETGDGIIIETKKEEPQQNGIKISGVSPDTMDNINKYLQNIDQEIEEQEAKKEEILQKTEEPEEEDEEKALTEKEMNQVYSEAVVVIDKTGMGSVINFTDEEREKLTKTKVIKLQEVETVELSNIKIKKLGKKQDLESILKKRSTSFTSNIVLPASGYMATMKGCSTYEMISLFGGDKTPLLDIQEKWSLIHDKIESTSIGKMNYDDFLRNTAQMDYEVFIYGILTATYPDIDKMPLKCEQQGCNKEFDHPYSVKSLIRAEKMADSLKDRVMHIVDNSYTLDMAKKFHDESPLMLYDTFKLPESEIIVKASVLSVYDYINKSVKELSENKETKYQNAAVLSSVVNSLYIPDDGEYIVVDSPLDVTKVIYTLGTLDLKVLTKRSDMLLKDLNFEFGLMNITCPHCGRFTASVPLNIDSLLFFRYQQEMSTQID